MWKLFLFSIHIKNIELILINSYINFTYIYENISIKAWSQKVKKNIFKIVANRLLFKDVTKNLLVFKPFYYIIINLKKKQMFHMYLIVSNLNNVFKFEK